jgi:Holliday junction resolvase
VYLIRHYGDTTKILPNVELAKELRRRRIRGRNFEYRVRGWLIGQGYYVRRAYASAFPDLLVARDNKAFFVEVKTKLKYFSKTEKQRFDQLYKNHLIPGFVAYKDDKRKIRMVKITS